jgi:hypothetical protein
MLYNLPMAQPDYGCQNARSPEGGAGNSKAARAGRTAANEKKNNAFKQKLQKSQKAMLGRKK